MLFATRRLPGQPIRILKKLLDPQPSATKTAPPAREAPVWARVITPRVALLLGLILLAFVLAVNWRVSRWGEDFGHLYVMGKSLVLGFNIYAATDLSIAYRDL